RTRVLVLVVVATAVGVLAYAGWWLATPRHRISLNSSVEIQHGMTLEQVEAILGVPPGNYATQEEFRRMGGGQTWHQTTGGRCRCAEWVSDELAIWVYFDPDGTAKLVGITDIGGHAPEPLLKRMPRWLGW